MELDNHHLRRKKKDIDKAPREVVAILTPLVQEGILTIPNLGRQIRAAPGFQLFLPQRESVRKELAKLVRIVDHHQLKAGRDKDRSGQGSPSWLNREDIENVLQDHPQDLTGEAGQNSDVQQAGQCEGPGELVYEGAGPLNQQPHQAAEILFQDAENIFYRYIP